MGNIGRWVCISCYKHDGSIHRRWDRGFIVDENDDYIVIASKRAKVTEANGRCWYTKEPAVTIFSKKEWWNVICMFKEHGVCYYCNIASPSVITRNSIVYIDYDLDVKYFEDKAIRLLDQKEYVAHKKKYNYGDNLDRIFKYTSNEIVKLMKNNAFPFDDLVIKDYYNEYIEKTGKKNGI